jgi:hypothetical protein
MTTKISTPMNDAALAAIHDLARQRLSDGCNPGELCSALVTVAVRIGLDLAPNAGVAFAVLMSAVSDAAAEWASSQSSPRGDADGVTASRKATIH